MSVCFLTHDQRLNFERNEKMRACWCTLGGCTKCGAGCCRDCVCFSDIIYTTTTTTKFDGWKTITTGPMKVPDYVNIPTVFIDGDLCMDKIQKQSAKRIEKRKKLINIHGGSCMACEQNFPQCAMDFHHLNPEDKRFGLGLQEFTRKWEDLLEESRKCILLCANCHRITHSEQNVNKNDIMEDIE